MLRLLVLWEVELALAIFLVATGEYIGLVFARRQGLTRNVSRLVTHGFMAALSLIYAAGALWWWRALRQPEALAGVVDSPAVNWTYLPLGTMIGVVACYELWQHARAMALGLTRSVPRLITHLVMVLLIVMLIGLSVSRWQFYVDEYGASSVKPILVLQGEGELLSALLDEA